MLDQIVSLERPWIMHCNPGLLEKLAHRSLGRRLPRLSPPAWKGVHICGRRIATKDKQKAAVPFENCGGGKARGCGHGSIIIYALNISKGETGNDVGKPMITYALYALAALAEIGGCFAFWAWMRMGKPMLWLAPGMVSLALFAWLLALVPSEAAGRTYAAYGGIYVVASILWLWLVEGRMPDRWDISGAAVCVIGTSIILFGSRG